MVSRAQYQPSHTSLLFVNSDIRLKEKSNDKMRNTMDLSLDRSKIKLTDMNENRKKFLCAIMKKDFETIKL